VNVRGFGSNVPVSSRNIVWDGTGDLIAEHLDALLDAGANAGFGVAVRRDIGGSGGAENLLFSRALWVDIDDPDISVESIDQRAETHGYPSPTYTVRTGGGVHLYWILVEKEPLETQVERRDFSKRLRQLTAAFEGDTKCCEPARIMRAPGTPNMKEHYPVDDRPQCYVERHLASTSFNISSFRMDSAVRSGGRNNAVFNEARRLRDSGANRQLAEAQASDWNTANCVPPLSSDEVVTIVGSAFSRATGGVTHEVAARFPEPVESEVASFFVRDEGENLRYNSGLGWMVWNGTFWERDEPGAMDCLRRYLTRMRSDAGQEGVEAIQRLCTRLLNYRKIKDILALAGTMRAVWIDAEDFDNSPYKVNFRNLTLTFDQATGQYTMGPHEKTDYLTSTIPSDFKKPAEGHAHEFASFLMTIFDGDVPTIHYLQKRLGMCLMGNVGDSKALIMYGDGANGKSVLAGVLQESLGDYCFPVPASTLTGKSGSDGGGETKVASIQGKRVGLVHEFGSSTRLNDERFKMLTGGEALISGRHLYGRHFSFRPVTAFVIMSNYLPTIQDHSHGGWRRMALIKFPVQIPEHEQDSTLMRRLAKDEKEFVLYWLVEGLSQFLAHGAEEPESSSIAMSEYKEGEDAIGSFLQETYEQFTDGRVPLNDAYQAFHKWVKDQGSDVRYSKVNFGRLITTRFMPLRRGPEGAVSEHPIAKETIGGTVYFTGIGCKSREAWSYDVHGGA